MSTPASPNRRTVARPSAGLSVETDCAVSADSPDGEGVTVRVVLSGSVTIPGFAVRELLKGHAYTLTDLVLDQLRPEWLPALYPLIDRGARSALTGVGKFDPVMTETLR